MEYELLTGPRQGDCGGGDRIHNHTIARKCTKTLEMFPTNKSVTNTGKYSTTIEIVRVHSYQKIYKNSGGYIDKGKMSVTNAGKSTQNNKSWGEKYFHGI